MVARIGPVLGASAIGDVSASVYRSNYISPANTEAVTVYAADIRLLSTLEGHISRGQFLNEATSHYPAVVLGAAAATALGIDRADGSADVWLGDQWFNVVGHSPTAGIGPRARPLRPHRVPGGRDGAPR